MQNPIISQSPRYLIETIAISSVILIIISFLKIIRLWNHSPYGDMHLQV